MDLIKCIKPLTGEKDWPIWKRKVRDVLMFTDGCIEVVDKKIVQPTLPKDSSKAEEMKKYAEQLKMFKKANSYAKTVMTTAMTDAVYMKIMDKEFASEVYDTLKGYYEATEKDQVFKLCNDFFEFSWTSGTGNNISEHLTTLKNIWNELNLQLKNRKENELPELFLISKALHILPSHFENFKTSWMLLTRDTDKKFEELEAQLVLFERNRKGNCDKNVEKEEQEALVSKVIFKKCTKDFKNKKVMNEKKTNAKKDDVCNYCQKKGHWIRECYKWLKDGKPKKKEESNVVISSRHDGTDENVIALSVCENDNIMKRDSWWVDNGATKHITNRLDYFFTFQKFETPGKIKAAGKEVLTAVGKGQIKVKSLTNENSILTLNDVWYVPEVSQNLFSVLSSQDKIGNSKFWSTSTECCLEINGNPVLRGHREVGGTLFKADIVVINPSEIQEPVEIKTAVSDKSILQLYHERWGHQDKCHVKNKLKKELGIEVKCDAEICEPCIYGKSHRLPFGRRKDTSEPGELMSGDVCGPFHESFRKKKYLVVFKDSFSKYRYGYIIREKSEVKNALKEMIEHAKTQGHKIKEFLSDNGGEFDNEAVRKILREYGVIQRLTAPYTPQQNGGSERDFRTIIEMARTFKYSNSEVVFPDALWGEFVTSAIYILNRTGKSLVENKSPFEVWFNKKPRINHLRIIGSLCYAHIPDQKRQKMDKKAIKGFLVGYDGNERYRIYVREERKVILSRDVKFEEKCKKCEESEKNEEEQNNTISSKESESTDKIDEEQVISEENILLVEDLCIMADQFINEIKTPETYVEALESEQKNEWLKAIQSEMNSLKENKTWILTKLPKDAKAISSKWVFKIKRNVDDSVEKYKARLVVKGYNQRKDIDYSQTFSPVARLSTIRVVLAIATTEKMHLSQFDVSTAFLYGELQEQVFMEQPEGFNDNTGRVCNLKKSLYGLKQAPRCWNERFGKFLLELDFKASEADPCLFVRKIKGEKLIIVLYVDDGLVAATKLEDLKQFLCELKSEFKITTRDADYFLGLEIEKIGNDIKIKQKAYTKKILDKYNFAECKPVSVPILKGTECKSGKENEKESNYPYRQAVGVLMYLMLGTRPDLAYCIGFLSRSLEKPSKEDIVKVKRVFRYLAGTIDLGIMYKSNAEKGVINCFSDADFGGCNETGRSTTGVVVLYASGIITWMSQRQPIVATSTTEAEIIAANEAAKEMIWLTRLFTTISELKQIPVLQVDNSAAVKLSQNPEFHRRTKHIAIKYFFIREKIAEKRIGIKQISTEHQLADVMTKPLSKIKLKIFCDQMGLT